MLHFASLFTSEVIVALIGLIGVLVTLASKQKSQRIQQETQQLLAIAEEHAKELQRELTAQAYFFSFGFYLHEWQSIESQAMAIINETEVDRILMFQAWNGKNEPRRTTAVCQFRAEGQEMVTYREVEPDLDYKKRLRSMKEFGPHHFTVSEIPDSLIKSVYQAEGVLSAVWMHVSSILIPNTPAAAMSYTSYASHTVKVISDETITRCRLLNDRLTRLAQDFEKDLAE